MVGVDIELGSRSVVEVVKSGVDDGPVACGQVEAVDYAAIPKS
jgi:hypothetical protein